MATLTVSKAEEARVKALGFFSNKGTDNFSGRVITKNGKVSAEVLRNVAEAAERFGNGEVLVTTRLTFECPGIPFENIEPFMEFLAEKGLETGGSGKRVRPVVSCKGTTCQYGLIDTYDLSEKIHDEFYTKWHNVNLPHKFKIAVGGCPNNCVKPNLNDLGVIGARVPAINLDKCKSCKKCAVEAVCPVGAAKLVDGTMVVDYDKCINCGRCIEKCYFKAMDTQKQGYKVYVGGRWGKQISHGKLLGKIFTDEAEIMKTIEKAILFFRENGNFGERFAVTVERVGFDKVEKELLSDDILLRKEEILAREF